MSILLANVKEHAPLSAGANVDHGVEVKTTEDHENTAADRGGCVSACCAELITCEHLCGGLIYQHPSHAERE